MKIAEAIFLGVEPDGSGFLLKLKGGEGIELNAIGVAIWRLLEKNTPRCEIAAQLAAQCSYELPPEAAKDINLFIQQLIDGNWIVDDE